jgi:hypothetical protein
VWTTCFEGQNPAKIPRDVASAHVTAWISRVRIGTSTAPP